MNFSEGAHSMINTVSTTAVVSMPPVLGNSEADKEHLMTALLYTVRSHCSSSGCKRLSSSFG